MFDLKKSILDMKQNTHTKNHSVQLPDLWSCFQCMCGVIVVKKMKNVYQKIYL